MRINEFFNIGILYLMGGQALAEMRDMEKNMK